MKKLLLLLVMTSATIARSQTNQPDFFSNVTNLWYQGFQSNVLVIAQQRLSVNSNDIAGLLLMMEWHTTAGDNSELSNACQRVIDVGATITTTNFVAHYPITRFGAQVMLDFMTEYHPIPTEQETDKIKGLLPFKELDVADELEALKRDGCFQ